MKWYSWLGIGAIVGAIFGYRKKIVEGIPQTVEWLASHLSVEEVTEIYAAVCDTEARHDTAVEMLVDAAGRHGLGNFVTPLIAEQFIDNIDEILRRMRE